MEKWEKEHAQEVIDKMIEHYRYYSSKSKVDAVAYEGKIEGYIQGIAFADQEFSKKMKRYFFTMMHKEA